MKHVKLILLSFSKMKGALLFLIALITLALFVLLYLTGTIRYYGYSIERLEAANLENTVYLKVEVPDDYYLESGIVSASVYVKEVLDEIKELPGVSEVITLKQYKGLEFQGGLGYEIFAYDDEMLRRFEAPVDGKWLTDTFTEDGDIQVVLAGPAFDNYEINKTIRVNESQSPIDIYVSGKVTYPWYTLNLGNNSTDILAHYLMAEYNTILVKDDPSLARLLDEDQLVLYAHNGFVVLEDNITGEQREFIFDKLSSYGSYDTYNEIHSNSRDAFKVELGWVLPLPLFLFFSAFGCMFSIASLYVLRNIENQVIFFLCGCSRRRSLLLLVQGLVVISLLPALINSTFAALYPSLKKWGILNLGDDVIIDYSSIKVILLFLVIMIVLLLLIPIFIYRKNSPQQMYRRLSE